MSETFNLKQAEDLVAMFGGEDSTITVELSLEGHSGPGLYAHHTEYSSEGSILLGDPAKLPNPGKGNDEI